MVGACTLVQVAVSASSISLSAATGSGEGVLDGGQEIQALACTLVVRPLLHEVMIRSRRSVIAIQTREHFCLSMPRSLLRVRGAQGNSLLHTGKLLSCSTGHASTNRQRRCPQVRRPQQGKGPFFFADALLLSRAERRGPQRLKARLKAASHSGKRSY